MWRSASARGLSREGFIEVYMDNCYCILQILYKVGHDWQWQTHSFTMLWINYRHKEFYGTDPQQGPVL